jgi:hypothetical protein
VKDRDRNRPALRSCLWNLKAYATSSTLRRKSLPKWRRFIRYTPLLVYVAGVSAVVFAYGFFTSNSSLILPPFRAEWRVLSGIELILVFFPTAALAGITLPFGIIFKKPDESAIFIPGHNADFIRVIGVTLVIASLTAVCDFFARPYFFGKSESLSVKTETFERSISRLNKLLEENKNLEDEELREALHLIAVCNYIWSDNLSLARIVNRVMADYDSFQFAKDTFLSANPLPGLGGLSTGDRLDDAPSAKHFSGGREPVNAEEALQFARAAYAENRLYDAHWLARIASFLAKEGSLEQDSALAFQVEVWNAIASLEPLAEEVYASGLYRTKREGYKLMSEGNWIRAYYTFIELQKQNSGDADLPIFIATCREGLANIAFFLDELDFTSADLYSSAIFSLPKNTGGGRVVLRFDSLSCFSDAAWGEKLEALAFDSMRKPQLRITAPFVKIAPITVSGSPKTALYLRSLDRDNRALRWNPVWEFPARDSLEREASVRENPANSRSDLPETLDTLTLAAFYESGLDGQYILDISYENFLLAAKMLRSGATSSSFLDAYRAELQLESAGFAPEVFNARMLQGLEAPLFMLPLCILAFLIGHRYRIGKRKARWSFIPMLIILPMVYDSVISIIRRVAVSLSTLLCLNLSFPLAVSALLAIAGLSFAVLMFALATEKE